jgi:hypothetical protein
MRGRFRGRSGGQNSYVSVTSKNDHFFDAFGQGDLLKAVIGATAAKWCFVPLSRLSPSNFALISYAAAAKVGREPILSDAAVRLNSGFQLFQF